VCDHIIIMLPNIWITHLSMNIDVSSWFSTCCTSLKILLLFLESFLMDMLLPGLFITRGLILNAECLTIWFLKGSKMELLFFSSLQASSLVGSFVNIMHFLGFFFLFMDLFFDLLLLNYFLSTNHSGNKIRQKYFMFFKGLFFELSFLESVCMTFERICLQILNWT
jgi:hypothetical protein